MLVQHFGPLLHITIPHNQLPLTAAHHSDPRVAVALNALLGFLNLKRRVTTPAFIYCRSNLAMVSCQC